MYNVPDLVYKEIVMLLRDGDGRGAKQLVMRAKKANLLQELVVA